MPLNQQPLGGARPLFEGMDAIQRYEDEHANDEAQLTEAERQMHDEELSFYSNSENEFGDDNIWGLLSGVGGNIYEWCVR
jgi:hypothetical protein